MGLEFVDEAAVDKSLEATLPAVCWTKKAARVNNMRNGGDLLGKK